MSSGLYESISYDVLKYKYVKEFCQYINEDFYSRKEKFLRFWGIGTKKTLYVEDVYMDFLKACKLPSNNEELNRDIIDFVVKNSMTQKVQMTYDDLAVASTISKSQQRSRVIECAMHYPEYTQKAWRKCFDKQFELGDIDIEL